MTMYETKEEKKRLRQFYAARRKQLQSAQKDGAICNYVLDMAGTSFFSYYSFGSEVDTHAVIARLLAAGKTVCLPRVVGNRMLAVSYAGERLEKGAFGIYEPRGEEDMLCEVALVPLLAVDGEGNRLGYGGGYYDRYFSQHPAMLRVGLCYRGQVSADRLPREKHDVPLHAIVTEEGFQNLTEHPFACIINRQRG